MTDEYDPRMDNQDFASAEMILTHNREGIGMIQSALAGAIDPQLQENRDRIAAIRKQLTKQANKIRGVTRGTTSEIAQELGRVTTDVLTPAAQIVARIGQAAATGQLHSLIPPDPPPGTGQTGGFSTSPLPPGLQHLVDAATAAAAARPGDTGNVPAPVSGTALTTQIDPTSVQQPTAKLLNQPLPAQPVPGVPAARPVAPALPQPAQPAPFEAPSSILPTAPPTADACQQFPITVPPTGDFCRDILRLEAYLIAFGNTLMEGPPEGYTYPQFFSQSILWIFYSWYLPAESIEHVKPAIDRLGQGLSKSALCYVLDNYMQAMSAYYCSDIDSVRALLAVKAGLDCLDSLSASMQVGGTHSDGQNVSFGLSAFGLGAGYTSGSGMSSGSGFGAGMKLTLAPLVDVIDYLIARRCPSKIPGVGEVIDTYLHGQYTESQARCLIEMNDQRWDLQLPHITARRSQLDTDQLIEYGRRSGFNDDEIADSLRTQGWINKTEALSTIQLYDELPTIQDTLHFLQRNVFDTQYVEDYRLMEGFSERFWPRYGPGLRAIGVTEQRAKDFYAAHWVMPSIGQLAEMMQRLRPGRVDPRVAFTETDFLRVLAEQDVAPYFRQRLLYTAYHTLPMRQLTQAVQQGEIGLTELVQRFQDIGYRNPDAVVMAKTLHRRASRARAHEYGDYTMTSVVKLIHAGVFTLEQGAAALAEQGYSSVDVQHAADVYNNEYIGQLQESSRHESLHKYAAEIFSAYRSGALDRATASDALAKIAYLPDAAALELDSIDLQVRQATATEVERAVRKSYMLGGVDAAGVLAALQMAGITQAMSQTLLSRWTLERTTPRVAASAAQIMRLTGQGIMSIGNMQARLNNLGWTPDAIQLQTIIIENQLATAQAKANSQQAAQLLKAQKAAQAVVKQTQKASCKIYTPGKMVRWYALGIIDEAVFRRRLNQCGYPEEEINLLFAEARKQAEKAGAHAVSKATGHKEKQPKGFAANTLKRFYAERVIDRRALTHGLEALGYSGSDLSELINDANIARTAKDKKAEKAGPTGIQLTGPGAATD